MSATGSDMNKPDDREKICRCKCHEKELVTLFVHRGKCCNNWYLKYINADGSIDMDQYKARANFNDK